MASFGRLRTSLSLAEKVDVFLRQEVVVFIASMDQFRQGWARSVVLGERCPNGSVVERVLGKNKVVGSIPTSGSNRHGSE